MGISVPVVSNFPATKGVRCLGRQSLLLSVPQRRKRSLPSKVSHLTMGSPGHPRRTPAALRSPVGRFLREKF
jgi:hypothetical protein